MIRFVRLFKSFIYAFRGLFKTFREEQNLRIQAAVAVIVVILGLYFKISPLEWSILIITITLVILMEIANSAVERVTDVLKPRINGYVKEIKDIMAAAVMLSSFAAVIIGLIILGPPLIEMVTKLILKRNLDIFS
jgi:diacylglycerol kinase